MEDQSYLDRKYFIDAKVYNCPFCNRNNVAYTITEKCSFDWDTKKKCYVIFIECNSCNRKSLHLSFNENLCSFMPPNRYSSERYEFNSKMDIDTEIFFSKPTSFFIIDDRIPRIIRELIMEAEGCLKMNYLTGSSACMRKAIYELLILEKIAGNHYEERIKNLKSKYPNSDPELYDILSHIQEMTSDKIHEQSWEKWDSSNLHLIIETLKNILYEIYVTPKEREERNKQIGDLRQKSISKK